MGHITALVRPHRNRFTISVSGNMTESKSPELEDEFMEYFKVTKFKTQRTSAEIIADFTKFGPLKIVSF